MTIFWTENVVKAFGAFRALDGISLKVEKDEIRAIIGPNGSGKTTFFNVISGKYQPTSGKVYFEGEEISQLKPHIIAQKGITRAFQIINIFPNLSVLDNIMISLLNRYKKNLTFFSSPYKQKEIMDEALLKLENVGMGESGSMIANRLSHGDKKKLDMGIAIARNPKLLLLDEPTAGLNPDETQMIIDLIKSIAQKEKLTVIFTEHDLHVVFSIADSITVFQQGKVIAEDTPVKVKRNKRVIEAYLGEEFQ